MQVTVKVWAAYDRSLWETFDYYVRTYGDGEGGCPPKCERMPTVGEGGCVSANVHT